MALSNKQKSYINKNKSGKSTAKIASELNLDPVVVKEFIEASTPSAKINASRKKLFYGIMLAIPVLFFILLEAGLRIADYRGNLDLFVYPESLDGKIAVTNQEFTARYFFNVRTFPSPSSDTFLAEKPENGYRVFVMGGSTTNGYPYGYNATFSRMFRDMLQDAAPDRYVEVVNVATSAINTYTLYDQVDEILEQKPDLILIYAGHNEYYGALGVGSSETFGAFPGFIRTYLKLQRLKTFLLIRDAIVNGGSWISGLFGKQHEPVGGTLMQRVVREQQIPLDSDLYELGKLQFESNLNAILRKFDSAGLPVFIGSLASNLKDQPPFISIETENHPAANQVFTEASQAYQNQLYEDALDKFIYAKNLDVLRFRAPSGQNDVIRRITETFDNAFYVPVKEAFMGKSEYGIIGSDLMLEHLHPNYTGYHLMSLAFFDAFLDKGTPGIAINSGLLDTPEGYFERSYMTEYDKRVGAHRIKLLMNGWPFRDEKDPTGYPDNYSPTSLADSIAYSTVNQNVRWDMAKVRLAEVYQVRGMFEESILEYKGLIRDQPYNDSPLLRIARIYLDLNDFKNARPYLEQALEIEKSAFASRMLGAVEVDAGNLERGIELLELSRSIEPYDSQTLFNLSGAYGLSRKFQKAHEILRILEERNPDFPGARSWRIQLDGFLESN